MYQNTWIVVANSSKARFFQAVSNQDLKEFDTLLHPESRMKGEELLSDKPGTTFDSQGPGRHYVGKMQDLKDSESKEFAKEIGKKLMDIAKEHPIEQLFLASSPKFLGVLVKEIDGNLAGCLKEAINHDITSLTPEEIREYLPYVL